MNKKSIALIVFGLLIAATAYLVHNSIDDLEEFDFSDPFETDFDDE